jgi:hypothetical protein
MAVHAIGKTLKSVKKHLRECLILEVYCQAELSKINARRLTRLVFPSRQHYFQ